MIRITLVAALLAATFAIAGAETPIPPAPPIGIITQEDATDLQWILSNVIPPNIAPPIIKWFTTIIKRQQDALKQASPPEPVAKPN